MSQSRDITSADSKPLPATTRRVRFGRPSPASAGPAEVVTVQMKAKPKRQKPKIDKALLNKSRELRDRYLEQFNTGQFQIEGKYDVTRLIESRNEDRGSKMEDSAPSSIIDPRSSTLYLPSSVSASQAA